MVLGPSLNNEMAIVEVGQESHLQTWELRLRFACRLHISSNRHIIETVTRPVLISTL